MEEERERGKRELWDGEHLRFKSSRHTRRASDSATALAPCSSRSLSLQCARNWRIYIYIYKYIGEGDMQMQAKAKIYMYMYTLGKGRGEG